MSTFDFDFELKLNPPQSAGPIADQVEKILEAFGLYVKVKSVVRGPRVDTLRTELLGTTSIGRLRRICDDLSARLERPGVKLDTGDDGSPYLQIPRKDPEFPGLSTLPAPVDPYDIQLGVGMDGRPLTVNLRQAAHILCGGSTGSGKSTLLKTMLQSLLSRHDRSTLRVLIGDPKRVDFPDFKNHPAILDVVHDRLTMRDWLRAIYEHMEQRYCRLAELGLADAADAPGMPPIWVLIDEFTAFGFRETPWAQATGTAGPSDSMAGVTNLLERGRAAGIHLLLATQNPVVTAVPGALKACCPTRIALRVPQVANSRVIIDRAGAEALLGRGDAYLSAGELRRFQAAVPDMPVAHR